LHYDHGASGILDDAFRNASESEPVAQALVRASHHQGADVHLLCSLQYHLAGLADLDDDVRRHSCRLCLGLGGFKILVHSVRLGVEVLGRIGHHGEYMQFSAERLCHGYRIIQSISGVIGSVICEKYVHDRRLAMRIYKSGAEIIKKS
jgi:hypothetical protein